MTGEITLRGRVLPDRRPQEQDPRRAPVGCRSRDPAAQEREGPARHPRGDPQADQARPRRLDGPGARGGPPARSRSRSSRRRRRSSGDTPKRRPRTTRSPAGFPPASSRRPGRADRGEPSAREQDRTGQAAGPSGPAPADRAMEYRDYYATLGVPRTATQAEIKKAFRKLARKHHPDVNKSDAAAERRFKEVNEANDVLGDPEKRKPYDQLGANWEAYQRAARAAPAAAARRPVRGPGSARVAGGVRFEFRGDLGEDLAGFSDFFRDVLRGGAGRRCPRRSARWPGRARRRPGPRWAASGTVEDLFGGMGLDEPGAGSGAGRAADRAARQAARARPSSTCPSRTSHAGTTARVEVGGKRLEVTIPRGVDDGQRIRLSGKAAPAGPATSTCASAGPAAPGLHAQGRRRPPRAAHHARARRCWARRCRWARSRARCCCASRPRPRTAASSASAGTACRGSRRRASGDLVRPRRVVVLPTDLRHEARTAARTARLRPLPSEQPDPRQPAPRSRPDR